MQTLFPTHRPGLQQPAGPPKPPDPPPDPAPKAPTPPPSLAHRRDFDGETYDKAKDGASMGRALDIICAYMSAGRWHTLADLAQVAGITEAGASARVRDLRKPRFGGYTIERRRQAEHPRVWEYRMQIAGVSRAKA